MSNHKYPVSEPLVVDEYWRFQTLFDNLHNTGGFLIVSSTCKYEPKVFEIHFDISHEDRRGLRELDLLIKMLKEMKGSIIRMAADNIGRQEAL